MYLWKFRENNLLISTVIILIALFLRFADRFRGARKDPGSGNPNNSGWAEEMFWWWTKKNSPNIWYLDFLSKSFTWTVKDLGDLRLCSTELRASRGCHSTSCELSCEFLNSRPGVLAMPKPVPSGAPRKSCVLLSCAQWRWELATHSVATTEIAPFPDDISIWMSQQTLSEANAMSYFYFLSLSLPLLVFSLGLLTLTLFCYCAFRILPNVNEKPKIAGGGVGYEAVAEMLEEQIFHFSALNWWSQTRKTLLQMPPQPSSPCPPVLGTLSSSACEFECSRHCDDHTEPEQILHFRFE